MSNPADSLPRVAARYAEKQSCEAAASVHFFNTYRPVVPLYESVAAVAAEHYGWRVVACVSDGSIDRSTRRPRPATPASPSS